MCENWLAVVLVLQTSGRPSFTYLSVELPASLAPDLNKEMVVLPYTSKRILSGLKGAGRRGSSHVGYKKRTGQTPGSEVQA